MIAGKWASVLAIPFAIFCIGPWTKKYGERWLIPKEGWKRQQCIFPSLPPGRNTVHFGMSSLTGILKHNGKFKTLRDPGFKIRDQDLKKFELPRCKITRKWDFWDPSQTLPRFWDQAKIFQDPHLFGKPFYTPTFRFLIFYWDKTMYKVDIWNPCSPNTKLYCCNINGPKEIRGFEWVARLMFSWSCELD